MRKLVLRKLLPSLLTFSMLLTMLPAGVRAEEKPDIMPEFGSGRSESPSVMLAGLKMEHNEPMDWRTVPMPMGGGSTESLPTRDNNNPKIVYCNGTPVLVKEENGDTYLYDMNGNQKYLNGESIKDCDLYGGSNQRQERGDTSITMESGAVNIIFGGDCFSNRIGNTNVTINGGEVSSILGGSYGHGSNTQYGRVEGNTNLTLNGGTVTGVYGGGWDAGTQVTGTCYIKTGENVSLGFLAGGAISGSVGSTDIKVNGTRMSKYKVQSDDGTIVNANPVVVGAGTSSTSVTGDVSLTFSGTTDYLIGGSQFGQVQDTDVILEKGGIVNETLFASGERQSTVTRNATLVLAGGVCPYIYGGSSSGIVTGNVQIDVKEPMSWNSYVRAGGQSKTSLVQGNTVINLNASLSGLASGGGYEGSVNGSATINVKDISFQNGLPDLPYLTGESNYGNIGDLVKGKTTLNLIDPPREDTGNFFVPKDRCWNFDAITLNDSRLQLNKCESFVSLEPKDLSLGSTSVLSLLKGSITVSGNFTGGGTLEITEGNTFSVTGATTGISSIKLLGLGSASLGNQVKLIDGANAQIANYKLSAPAAGYTLVKKSDGLYAVSNEGVGLTLSFDNDMPVYGDSLTVTVQTEANKGVTDQGQVTLMLSDNSYSQTKAVDGAGKAVFTLPGTLIPATYTLSASFVESNLRGSKSQQLTIGKRPLTLDVSNLQVFSRPYIEGNTDVYVTLDYLKEAAIKGYCNGDSGAELAGTEFLYRLSSDTAGTNKQVSSKPSVMYLNSPMNTKYVVNAPDIKINITPKKVNTVNFANIKVNYCWGTPLSGRLLQNGDISKGTFEWRDKTINPPVGQDFFDVVFKPFDKQNYDYSQVSGWDPATETVIRKTPVVTTKKEKPTDMQVFNTYTLGGAEQNVTIDLVQAGTYPSDAGRLSFTYKGSASSEGLLSEISVTGSALTFTIPATASAIQAVNLPVTVTSDHYSDFILNVRINLTEKTSVGIRGIIIPDINEQGHYFYNGKAVTYAGTPVFTGGYNGNLVYEWYDAEDNKLNQAPKDVGRYSLTAKIPESDQFFAGAQSINFQIVKANLIVRAEDKSVVVGSDAPVYTTAFDGLADGEIATAALACSYVKGSAVSGKAGTYRIIPSGLVLTNGNPDNYRIGYKSGTLTVTDPLVTPEPTITPKPTAIPVPTILPYPTVIPVPTDPPAAPPDQPMISEQVKINVAGKVDAKGNITARILVGIVTEAIDKALADAGKNGSGKNGIYLEFRVENTGKAANSITVNLPNAVQEAVIKNKIKRIDIVLNNPDIRIGMDLKAIAKINKQAQGEVNITATRIKSRSLSGNAKKAIGSGPAFNLKVGYGRNKKIGNFGTGIVSITIPYKLSTNEKAGNICAVYVDGKGKVQWLTKSVYDSVAKALRFQTNHFSVFGVGFIQKTPALTDIANHWAKNEIEYVASRGLVDSTVSGKFSPNKAVTRGMFVTALGRLSNVNRSKYKSTKFTDVAAKAYYAPYVEWAVKKGIASGTTATTFSPNKEITRQEMAVMMRDYVKAVFFTLPKCREAVTFADHESIAGMAKRSVKTLQMAGVLNGRDGNRFDPAAPATKAELSALLCRFVELGIDVETAQGIDFNDSGSAVMYENGKMVKSASRKVNGRIYDFNSNGEASLSAQKQQIK